MKYLVVGGNGFIGRSLCGELRRRGHDVTIWSSQGESPEINAEGKLSASARISAGTQAIVFLSQSPHFRANSENPEHLYQVNSKLPLDVARLAADQGVDRFCYFSTGSVYAPSLAALTEASPIHRSSPYALSKIQGEEALNGIAKQIRLLILRPFFAFGPGQSGMLIPSLTERIRVGVPIDLHPSEDETPDLTGGLILTPIFVGDLARVVVELLDRGVSGTYNVAGQQPLSLHEIGLQIASRLKTEARFNRSGKSRETNYIADISKLKSVLPVRFTSFTEALDV